MTRNELMKALAEESGTDVKSVNSVLQALAAVVSREVKSGSDVRVPGLGKFSRTDRKARKARNPQTGETVNVPAKKLPSFSASAELKDVVAGARPVPAVTKAPASKAASADKPAKKTTAKRGRPAKK